MQNNLLLNQKFFCKILFLLGVFQLLTVTNSHAAFETYKLDAVLQKVTGTVLSGDDGLGLIGASIVIKGTTRGTVTDFEGRYEIEAEPTDILVFSYTGMASQEILVGNQSTIDITLSADSELLEEVVVIGYGTQKKSHLTGSISKVENKNLDQMAVARVDDALVGQVSGVNIQATNGEVGSAPTIRIRGTGSITGDSGPLVVLDGVVVDADFLGNMDMNDIESFEVLKDAASAAIFGSRGAIPFLKKGEHPSIINYTSNAAWNAGGPGAGIYGTSKAGVHTITRALAKDLAEYGIRANAVSPRYNRHTISSANKINKTRSFCFVGKQYHAGKTRPTRRRSRCCGILGKQRRIFHYS